MLCRLYIGVAGEVAGWTGWLRQGHGRFREIKVAGAVGGRRLTGTGENMKLGHYRYASCVERTLAGDHRDQRKRTHLWRVGTGIVLKT